MNADGVLQPPSEEALPWMPRTWLEPVATSDVVLGNVNALEAYLTTHLLTLPEDTGEAWKALLLYAQKMLGYVSKDTWRAALEDLDYKLLDDAFIVQEGEVKSFGRNISLVYEQLAKRRELPGLVQTYTRAAPTEPEPHLKPEAWREPAKRHLGSFGNKTALSPSQRESLLHALQMRYAEVLAVSGPPGTGKTTLIQSVVASAWVAAALEERAAPVIVVTSTNNQAVTNVLDSFAKARQVKRWLPEPVTGFGLYLINQGNKQKDALRRGIPVVDKKGKGFPQSLEHAGFFHPAKAHFLSECSHFFGKEVRTLSQATDLLHAQLKSLADRLNNGVDCAYTLANLRARVKDYGEGAGKDDLSELVREAHAAFEQRQAEVERLEGVKTRWIQYVANESIFYSLFPVNLLLREKRMRKRQLFWRTHLLERSESDDPSADLEKMLVQIRAEALKAQQQLEEAERLLSALRRAEQNWRAWCDEVGANIDVGSDVNLDIAQLYMLETTDGKTNGACLHNWLDTRLRFDLFNLATHLFESRWLREVEESDLLEPDHKPSRARGAQEEKWRRYAMLTPCFVTTIYTGPGFFDYYTGEARALFNFIDLLIVDEAGQVAPEVSGGMMALAKKALIIGDSKQLEPVWSIEEKVDRANLKRHCLADNDERFEALKKAGFLASSGSVMQLAQCTSKYQEHSVITRERGMFLAEHYRCAPKIIAYCDELAYAGKLRPKRDVKLHPWTHLGYVHVKGESLQTAGRSRYNKREAKTLVTWLSENRDALLAHYQKNNLSDVVSVITPFKAQARTIIEALAENGLALEKVGTVHTLQGAERPFVLFSPVYTSRFEGTPFFDRGVNMLNVAVSRAQDSFFVFGDMDIFDPALQSPSGFLARHLFADRAHEISKATLPERTSAEVAETVTPVRDLETHRAVLSKALKQVEKALVIVSPFLGQSAVDADAICVKLSAAKARGAEVTIYVDDGFTENLEKGSAKRAAAVLQRSGATLKVCHNIHSKIICIDERVFVEGSFNWLSASRQEKYARYDYSLIYVGASVAQFIKETLQDLEQRVVKVLRSR